MNNMEKVAAAQCGSHLFLIYNSIFCLNKLANIFSVSSYFIYILYKK